VGSEMCIRDRIEASKPLLPPTTRYVVIEGGNHAGFGRYGAQSGDGQATIAADVQEAQVVAATVELLASLAVR
ncbi:MAG: alpha/beta hydrolase, partial [Anaerolineae bacterium]|nr:alpha/beta hydrolase [Anaerolineae bacterium]